MLVGFTCLLTKRTFNIAVVVPVQGNLKLDGDGGSFPSSGFSLQGFHFTPFDSSAPTTRRVYMFKPASIRSLWSAVQSLMKLLERSDPTNLQWDWLSHYRQRINDVSKSVCS